jgi:CRP/FNR family transcriptional regulator, cyclic AMP receptor protein
VPICSQFESTVVGTKPAKDNLIRCRGDCGIERTFAELFFAVSQPMFHTDAIAGCDFLRDFPESLLQRFEELAHSEQYAPGAVLFVEGLEHPEFHIIAEGHVRLEMQVPHRGRVPIVTCGVGDILAWSALLGNSYMTTTAVALDSVKTIAFRGKQMRDLCEAENEIGYHVMRRLSAVLWR